MSKDNRQRLTNKVLDLIEDRFIDGMLGDEEISASVLEILRRVLHDNARLTVGFGENKPASSLETPGGDLEEEDVPNYGNVVDFK